MTLITDAKPISSFFRRGVNPGKIADESFSRYKALAINSRVSTP